MSEKFDSLFKEIFSYLDSGQYEIAILRINEILKIDLANSLAKNLLIFIYIQTKELEKAKELLKDLLKTNPHEVTYMFNLGKINIDLGEYNEGISLNLKVLENNPHHIQALYNISFCFFKLGNNTQSIDYLKNGIELQPDNFEFNLLYARCLENLKKLKEAESIYVKIYINNFWFSIFKF